MYFLALATDYDGTLADGGAVDVETRAALERFKETGRRLVLVTGRELDDLERVFGTLRVFDRVVAENGAVVHNPATGEVRALADPPPVRFIERLKERGVTRLSAGRVIVATWEPHEQTVLEVIHELGAELQIAFNKGAVMVLPTGINKAAGLEAALEELHLSPHNVVAVGDAENDHAFMHACGCAAAVANALPALKEEAHLLLERPRSAGVMELLELICHDDAALLPPQRHGIPVGTDAHGEEILLAPNSGSVLIAGRSGVGKSTLATALTERMAERAFDFCVFDPEGDYDQLEHAVALGDIDNPPQLDQVLKLLSQARTNVVVSTQALSLAERPAFFAQLLPQVASLRAATGRPHWLLIDETHHLLPAERGNFSLILPESLPAVILITVHPETVSPDALRTVGTVVAVGDRARGVIEAVCAATGAPPPNDVPTPADDQAVVWSPRTREPPLLVKAARPRQTHHRHTRKYAAGKLDKEHSFYFRGPRGALNLRAQNLILFLQIAAGVDEETWEHHRRAGDYSHWFRAAIKDDDLAREAQIIERDHALDAAASRAAIIQAVTRRYTAPVSAADS